MKKENGFSLIVLIVTIVVIIILSAITLKSSFNLIDDSGEAKFDAEATMDDEKIKEIMTYELAETLELIDVEIDLKRIELNNLIQIEYEGKTYGEGYMLYFAQKDIEKVEEETGRKDYYKTYKGLTKSYVANYETGDFKRLEKEWKFKN